MGSYVKKNSKCRRSRALEIKIFGKLQVLSFNSERRNYLNCLCSCGESVEVNVHYLLKGLKTSCGCTPENKSALKVGDVLCSNNHGEFEIIKIDNYKNVDIKFLTTGTIRTTTKGLALSGGVVDRNYPSVHGIGYLGYGKYKSRVNNSKEKTPEYRCWENMMSRCYYPLASRYEAYGGKGVTVCEEWLNFQTFADWFINNYRPNCDLDKDILGDGYQYSPYVCRFIPQSLNKLLTLSPTKLNKRCNNLPEGVSWDRKGKKLVARFASEILGIFDDPNEAYNCYIEYKTKYVRSLSEHLYLNSELCEDVYLKLKNYNAREGHK